MTNGDSKEPSPVASDFSTLGEVKWFGGFNTKTGRENDYGFISSTNGDLYFHHRQALCPPEFLQPGAKVIFTHAVGRHGKPEARSVQVLRLLSEAELVALLAASEGFPPEDVLSVILCRSVLAPFEGEALRAVSALVETDSASSLLAWFWSKFSPSTPRDPLFKYAPADMKLNICKLHFSIFRDYIFNALSSAAEIKTSRSAEIVYNDLDEQDEKLATSWAGRGAYDGLLAKMLSARAAERAAKTFYEETGSQVLDVSIMQLECSSSDWISYDLLVDSSVTVDVKNARRPLNAKNFYVEHTVPKFKLDRNNHHVKIAGILSPYMSLHEIKRGAAYSLRADRADIVFLGETDQASIEKLIVTFNSPTFEVIRPNERTVPSWAFDYPPAWYRPFSESLQQLISECEWPEGEEWDYVFERSETMAAIPALCATGKALPAPIANKILPWQCDFYARIQRVSAESLKLPYIFLTLLTDFLEKLKGGQRDFWPEGYLPLLFPNGNGAPAHNATHETVLALLSRSIFYPLGVIDPLGLVRGLIATLSRLWSKRESTGLTEFSNFKFSGLGILQGRESMSTDWKTLVAYCGGTVYRKDHTGKFLFNENGRPEPLGRCGNSPLIIGVETNCQTCGKLVCSKCGFCSLPCQKRRFDMAQAENFKQRQQKSAKSRARTVTSFVEEDCAAPPWEEIPLEAYEENFRR